MKRKYQGYRRLGTGLLLLLCGALLLTAFTGCSDQMLVNGEVVTAGTNGGATEPSAEAETTAGGNNISLGTEAPTEPPLVIGGSDPEEMFKDSEHILHAEFLDTGKSDCILIRMDGTVILVDTADSDDYAAVKAKLEEHGIQAINYLIISHYDNDHIGAMAGILQDFTVQTVYMPDYVRDSGLYRTMMSALESVAGRTQVNRISEDVRIELDYGSLWINTTSLYAAGETVGSDEANGTVEENNYSLITSVYFGEVSLLLAGDAEQDRMAEFNALFAEGAYPAYTVIKIPHHGDYFNAVGTCLESAKPRYCMVTVDDVKAVNAMLATKMLGKSPYYTCNGDICFSADGSLTKMLVTQK